VKTKKSPQGLLIALVVVGLIVVAALGYFLVLGPKRASAAEAQEQIHTLQTQIDTLRQATAVTVAPPPPVDVAELFRLSKAMPDRAEMAAVIIELNGIAKDTGITFESIDPAAATAADGYQVVPITLAFVGNYYNLSDFLFRLRNLVAVRDGRLSANGRLFNVQSVTFGAAEASFPQIKASVTVNAFVFGVGDAAATQGAPIVPPAAPPAEGATEAPAQPVAPPAPPAVNAVPATGGAS
jgi:hypothetical protein